MLILPNYRASWSSFYLIITPVHEQKVINPSTSIPASDCLVDIFLKKRYFSLFLGKKKKKKRSSNKCRILAEVLCCRKKHILLHNPYSVLSRLFKSSLHFLKWQKSNVCGRINISSPLISSLLSQEMDPNSTIIGAQKKASD